MRERAILIDSTGCTGCNSCTYKCIQEFGDHELAARGLFRAVALINDRAVYHQLCMHCQEPQCIPASAGAISKSAYGAVLLDATKLKNAKEVADSCPFHAVQYDEPSNGIVKCTMCAHRVREGLPPACVEACPVGAIQFGDYESIVAKAKEMAAARKLTIYGLEENGGTRVLILTKGNPTALGYPQVSSKRVATVGRGSDSGATAVHPSSDP